MNNDINFMIKKLGAVIPCITGGTFENDPPDAIIDAAIRVIVNTRATPDIPEKVDVEAITDIAWDVFFNSKKPAPYNQMKDVISHLAAAGYLREPLERIEGLEDA